MEFLRLAGISHTQLRAQDNPMAFVVARMEIDFDGRPRSTTPWSCARATSGSSGRDCMSGRASSAGGESIAEACETIVCIGLDGRPRRPPQALNDALKAWFLPRSP